MIYRFALSLLLFVLSGVAPVCLQASESTEKAAVTFHPIQPGFNDGQIAFWTARMLERFHYLRQPFDRSVSSKFLDRYLEALDPQHMHFVQSDLDQFEHYRTELGDLT